jgi:hypothetical protein
MSRYGPYTHGPHCLGPCEFSALNEEFMHY